MPRQSSTRQTQSQTQKVIINMQGATPQKKKHKKRSQPPADAPPPAMPPPPPPKLPPYTVFPSVQMIQNPNPSAPIPDYIQSGYNNLQQGIANMQTSVRNQISDLRNYLNVVNPDPATAAQAQQILDILQQQLTGDPTPDQAASDAGGTSGLLEPSDETASGFSDARLTPGMASDAGSQMSGMTTPATSEQDYPTPRQLDFHQFNTYTMTPAFQGTPTSANTESPTLPLPPSPFDNPPQEALQEAQTQQDETAAVAGPSYQVMEPTEEMTNLYNLRDPVDDEFLEADLQDMSEEEVVALYRALDPIGYDQRITRKETAIRKILGLQSRRRRGTPKGPRRELRLEED